jgi:hypothetical protein
MKSSFKESKNTADARFGHPLCNLLYLILLADRSDLDCGPL